MLNTLDKYSEIISFLKEDKLLNDINLMKKSLEERKFLLTFVGQFSAGKSKLINNILEQDILPVHISETTQVITFISYSSINYATITYIDLSTEEIALDKVKDIWQGQNYESNSKFKNIKHIEIFLNNDLLKKGLIIADTPGVNTVIKEHENITKNVLKSSEEIFYIMSKPLTEIDKNFILQILNMGLKLSCIRTHMDKINMLEENPYECVENDKNIISNIVKNSNINVYHISNEQENKWYYNIDSIKKYLNDELSDDVYNNIENSCKLKLNKMSESLMKKLNVKMESLEILMNGNKEKFNDEKLKIESNLNAINKKLYVKKRSINSDIRNAENIAKRDLIEIKNQIIYNGKKELEELKYFDDAQEQLKKISFRIFNDSYKKLQNIYIRPFNNIISDNNDIIKEDMEKCQLNNIFNIDEFTFETISEVAVSMEEDEFEVNDIKKQILELSNIIEEREKKLQEYNIEKDQKQEEINYINETVKDIEDEISSIGNYQCKFIEIEDDKKPPSEVLKNMGMALDWATLLIPSSAYVKIAGKIGKYSKVFGKTVSGFKKVDKFKDISYVLNNIAKSTRSTKKRTQNVIEVAERAKNVAETAGILDLLTFQYWFEKVGSAFDKPIRMEVDKEYEKQYNENILILNDKYKRSKKAELDKLQSLGLINNEEQKLKKEQEIDERRNIELMEEMKKQEDYIRVNSLNRSFNKLKEEYINWFEDKIGQLSDFVETKYDEVLKDIINNYYNKMICNINCEIDEWKRKNDELLTEFSQGEVKKLEEEIDKCNDYRKYLIGEGNV